MSKNQWFVSFFVVILILTGVFLARYFNPAIVIPATIIIAVIVAAIFSHQIKRRNELEMKEQIMPGIASKFGKSTFTNADALGFEHNGTLFEAKILWISTAEIEEAEFIIQSKVAGIQEKFFIQHQSVFSTFAPDCEQIHLSAMPEGFTFHSLNPQFLLSLLENKKILDEIYKYPSGWFNRFRIAFENDEYNISWRISGMSRETEPEKISEKLQQLCQTAIIFQDEMVKLLKR